VLIPKCYHAEILEHAGAWNFRGGLITEGTDNRSF
jgi:hypothetical protein